MNSMFDGVKVPTVANSLLTDASEVSLDALLKDMSLIELDFLRQCLVIDGQKRPSVEELLQHSYFPDEFKL
jgi:serine/threonine protein kinase